MEFKKMDVAAAEAGTEGGKAEGVEATQSGTANRNAVETEATTGEDTKVSMMAAEGMDDNAVETVDEDEYEEDEDEQLELPTVTAASIYREILTINNIPESMKDSYLRNLRNKFRFIVESVALRRMDEYKDGRNIMIPACDAPIVRNLILASLDDDYPFIVDWFNGALDLSDSAKCVFLGMSVKEPIMKAEMTGETDSVTVDEWLAAINGLINLNMAKGTAAMKDKLEEFRVNTLVMDSTVLDGDLTMSDGLGHRRYILQGRREKAQLSEDILGKIVQDLSFQQDYFAVLDQIMDYMMKDAEKKATPSIESYALAKAATECDSAQEMIGAGDESMVSEYFPWLKKIGAYLKTHPEEAARIEESVGTTGLVEFFN